MPWSERDITLGKSKQSESESGTCNKYNNNKLHRVLWCVFIADEIKACTDCLAIST